MVVRRRPGGGCAFALMLSMALVVVGGAAATAAATEETSSHAPPWLLSDDGLIGDCTNDGNTDCEQLTFDKCAACCDCQVINCGCNDDCLQDATRQGWACKKKDTCNAVTAGSGDPAPCCPPQPATCSACQIPKPPCGVASCSLPGETTPCSQASNFDSCCDGCGWCSQQACCVPAVQSVATKDWIPQAGYACNSDSQFKHFACDGLKPVSWCPVWCYLTFVGGAFLLFAVVATLVYRRFAGLPLLRRGRSRMSRISYDSSLGPSYGQL